MDGYAELYREELEDMLSTIKRSIEEGNGASEILRAFHTLKSSSRVMGFTKVSEICERMEEYAKKLDSIQEEDREIIRKAVLDIESLSS